MKKFLWMSSAAVVIGALRVKICSQFSQHQMYSYKEIAYYIRKVQNSRAKAT